MDTKQTLTFDELLATLPPYAEDEEGNCITCAERGFCQERADDLVFRLVYALRKKGVQPDSAALLQWLLDNDEIGTDKNEDVVALAAAYLTVAA